MRTVIMRTVALLPKAHLHLTGAMRPSTLRELAEYTLCREVLGLTDDQLAVLAEHSIRCSTAPPRVQQEPRGVDGWRCGSE